MRTAYAFALACMFVLGMAAGVLLVGDTDLPKQEWWVEYRKSLGPDDVNNRYVMHLGPFAARQNAEELLIKLSPEHCRLISIAQPEGEPYPFALHLQYPQVTQLIKDRLERGGDLIGPNAPIPEPPPLPEEEKANIPQASFRVLVPKNSWRMSPSQLADRIVVTGPCDALNRSPR